jgi:crescentin
MRTPVNALVTLITGRKPARAAANQEVTRRRPEPLVRSPQEDGERLHRIAFVIQNVMGELARIDELRLSLDELRVPIAAEFDARMKEKAQVAELGHRFSSTAQRLGDVEGERRHLEAQLHDASANLEKASAALEIEYTGRQQAEQEVSELRPALHQMQMRIEELSQTLADRNTEYSNLSIDRQSLLSQFDKLTEQNREMSVRLEHLHNNLVAATDQLADSRKRTDDLQARTLRSERMAEDLNIALLSERDRVAEHERALQAAQAGAARTIAALQAKDEEHLVEIASLKTRLEDAQTRCMRLEDAREKSAAGLQELNIERSELVRELAARDVSLIQLKNRVQLLETALDEARRRSSDVDAARLVAVQRAESLSKSFTALEGRYARSERVIEQRTSEVQSLEKSNEELRGKLAATTQDLQGVIVQQKAEIDMLRGALNAAQKTKHLVPQSN